MRRLSNVKGIHGALSEGRFKAPPLVDSTGSGPSNNLAMVQLSKLNSSLGKPGALSHYANVIKGRGQQRGATVQIVQAELTVGDQHEVFFVAGINSFARQGFTSAQLELLRLWDVRVAPCIARGMKKGPHAEENIGAYLHAIGARGVRWSQAVVGQHYDTRRGSRAYVCQACQRFIELVGGTIEDPHNLRR